MTTVTVTMSKEEFLSYCNSVDFKSSIKCGIIDLNNVINEITKKLMMDNIIKEDNGDYYSLIQKLNEAVKSIEDVICK